jgi:hypothetical protein
VAVRPIFSSDSTSFSPSTTFDERFGFTPADARALLQAARHLEHDGFAADAARFASIAERIGALTPPGEA